MLCTSVDEMGGPDIEGSTTMTMTKRLAQMVGMAITSLLLLAMTVAPAFACGKTHP
jgi:hypothetical protein